ncbi:uncharacterized protein LOC111123873 [Crassostrea virginica]
MSQIRFLQKIKGVGDIDHMKKSMLRTMTNTFKTDLHIIGKREKKASEGSPLYQINAVLSLHQSYRETNFNADSAKFLKYAPEHVGGGGRKKD